MPSIGNDLAAIRKHLGMSIEHIHQLTKIPVLTLKRIENNSIFTDQDENETYIRSFVRSYAKAMKIDLEVAIKALDQQDAGSYTNLLILEFPELAQERGVMREKQGDQGRSTEGEPREGDSTSTTSGDEHRDVQGSEAEGEQREAEQDESRENTTGDQDASAMDDGNEQKGQDTSSEGGRHENASYSESINSEENKNAEHGPTSQSHQKEPDTPSTEHAGGPIPGSPGAPGSRPPEKTGAESIPSTEPGETSGKSSGKTGTVGPDSPPSVNSVNWAAMGHKFRRMDNKTPAWVIALVVIIVLVLATLLLVYQETIFNSFADNSAPETTTFNEEAQPSTADLDFQMQENAPGSLQEEPVAEPEADPVATLGDTLQVTILAAYGLLEPVRVWSDLKPTMNPYWMNQRTAYHFQFTDTLRIRGQYSRMQLFMNGHRIDDFRENYYNSEEEAVEITRSIFTGSRNWGETVPLELRDDTPAPTVIDNPPLF